MTLPPGTDSAELFTFGDLTRCPATARDRSSSSGSWSWPAQSGAHQRCVGRLFRLLGEVMNRQLGIERLDLLTSKPAGHLPVACKVAASSSRLPHRGNTTSGHNPDQSDIRMPNTPSDVLGEQEACP